MRIDVTGIKLPGALYFEALQRAREMHGDDLLLAQEMVQRIGDPRDLIEVRNPNYLHGPFANPPESALDAYLRLWTTRREESQDWSGVQAILRSHPPVEVIDWILANVQFDSVVPRRIRYMVNNEIWARMKAFSYSHDDLVWTTSLIEPNRDLADEDEDGLWYPDDNYYDPYYEVSGDAAVDAIRALNTRHTNDTMIPLREYAGIMPKLLEQSRATGVKLIFDHLWYDEHIYDITSIVEPTLDGAGALKFTQYGETLDRIVNELIKTGYTRQKMNEVFLDEFGFIFGIIKYKTNDFGYGPFFGHDQWIAAFVWNLVTGRVLSSKWRRVLHRNRLTIPQVALVDALGAIAGNPNSEAAVFIKNAINSVR